MIGVAGCLFLFAAFFCWFPPWTWSRIPFVGDWPPRFQATVEGVRLMRHAAFSGWRWEFLGGYPIANDLGQALTLWAALPIAALGGPVGFHLTHLLMVAAIPALAWWSSRVAGDPNCAASWLTAGVAALFCAGYASPLVRSGDTDVLAGAVGAFVTLATARALRFGPVDGGRGGLIPAFTFVAALALTGCGLPAFFGYTLLLLVADAVIARDVRSLGRASVAACAAVVAGFPATWDLWRYPSRFLAASPAWHPARDLAVLVPMFAAPLLAALMMRRGRLRAVAVGVAMAAAIGLSTRMSFRPVPHVRSARDVDATLVDRITRLDGDLVVVEDTFSADAPVPVHFVALLPAATGKRLYAGMWDDGPWTPYRDLELQRWGVRHLLVWSDAAKRYLDSSAPFALREEHGMWDHYEYSRPVEPAAALIRRDPIGGLLRVAAAHRGDIVTIRTNYHPAWRAQAQGQPVSLFDADGQLAFASPRDGDYDVELVYPRRIWLIPSAVAALILGGLVIQMLR